MKINCREYCQPAREHPRKDKDTGGCCYRAIKPPVLSTRAAFVFILIQENRLNTTNVAELGRDTRKRHSIHNWVHLESSRGKAANNETMHLRGVKFSHNYTGQKCAN